MDKKSFDNFRKLIFETSGISLSEQKEALVSSRIAKRMRGLNIAGYDDYYRMVLADNSGKELRELLNAISTNVTHFFRESRHFDFLAGRVKELGENGADKIRIWCAACSTGEEPYTIAMTGLEAMSRNMDLRIIASDISTKVLQIAKFGVYKESDVANISKTLLKKYFRRGVGKASELVRVKEEIRGLISFSQINLSTPPYPIEGGLDMIFCRNVMIYFDNELRQKLVTNFENLLRPGGVLFIGMAESLSGVTKSLKTLEPSVYQKI